MRRSAMRQRVTFAGSIIPAATRSSKSFSGCVVAEVDVFTSANFFYYYRAFFAGVSVRSGAMALQAHASRSARNLLILVAGGLTILVHFEDFELSKAFAARIRETPPRHNTFFNSRASRVHSIFNARFLFFQFSFSGRRPREFTATPPTSFASRSCNFSRS